MKFDFTTIYDRRGRDAMAVDAVEKIPVFQPNEGFDAIPMWVADMNFATAPAVTEAIRKRLEHPLFGYFMTTDEYFDSIIRWQERRNGVTGLEKEHIGYENGVLGGLMSALAAVCARGDNVLVHSPTYIGFTRSIENGGYHVITSPLKPDRYGVQRMDFFDMETKIKRNDIRAVVFCSPHNPTGRPAAERDGDLRRDLVGPDPPWPSTHPPAIRVRRCPAAHRGPVRPLQDLQSGGAHRQLPHRV